MKQTATAAPVALDEYLGFSILGDDIGFTGIPAGWDGPTLHAESMALIRKRIWYWWHRVA